ncbi:MAG: aminopeptidase P family protein, partial [Deltaproteobacteria bacterium]
RRPPPAAPKAPEPPPASEGDDSFRSPDAEDGFAELRGFCDGLAPPNDAEFAARRRLLAEFLRARDLGAWVGEPGPNVAYLWGAELHRSERPILCIVRANGTSTWVVPAFERSRLAPLAGPDTEVIGWSEDVSPFETAALSPSRRTLLDGDMRLWVAEGIGRAVRGRTFAGDDPVRAARMVKSPAERALLDRANRATKAALDAVAERLEPGMTGEDVARLTHAALGAAGLERTWVLALVGPEAAYPHGTRSVHRIEPGLPILVDTGGRLHGYHSDITRTFVLGRPRADVAKAYETVRRAQAAAIDALRAGVTGAAADALARDLLEQAGYPGGFAAMTHRLGHGIGLEGHEGPYLVGTNHAALPAFATVSVEPGIYLPGRFGVRIEDIVEIREDGAHVYGPRARPL